MTNSRHRDRFWERAAAWFADHGITVEAAMTDIHTGWWPGRAVVVQLGA